MYFKEVIVQDKLFRVFKQGLKRSYDKPGRREKAEACTCTDCGQVLPGT